MGSIRFDKVNKVFGQGGADLKVLDDINLEIAEREFVAIVGPSGCGKTTCLRIVAGFEQPTSGVVSLNGKRVTRPGPDRAVVFQHFALFPWKTVRQNLDLGLRNKNLARDERNELIANALNLMNLESHAEAFPHQLSGGMQQRVAIARAYVLDPEVLLMDEPFGALDALTRAHLQESVMQIHSRLKNTVIMITHDVDEAVLLSDRIVMMTNGPSASIGQILDIDLARPRNRIELVGDPAYIACRSAVLKFLYERHRYVEAAA